MSFIFFPLVYLLFYLFSFCGVFPGGQDFPGSSHGKESASNAGDTGSIPGSTDPLKKGMATPSTILAWRTPWTEEPGGLQSMGSQRVGHD